MQKKFKNNILFLITIIFVVIWFSSCSLETQQAEMNHQNNSVILDNNTQNMTKYISNLTSELTFELSENVNVEKVEFKNKFGITVAWHLYIWKDMDISQKHPAIIIGTPYGWVKEQWAGIYAQNMAERWYIALAFDESYNGESSGEPRHLSSPELFVEDFSAAVDFMGTRSYVNRDKIWVIGICGSGWFALTASQVDPRIKAVVTASMYDISSMHRDGFGYSLTDEQRQQTLQDIAQQRWIDFESKNYDLPAGFPSQVSQQLPEWMNPIMSEFFEYYGMPRGHHKNAWASFLTISAPAFMNFPMMNYIQSNTTPKLMIIGENGHSNYYSQEAFEKASEPKELFVVPKARHIDLYDGGINGENYIPFDKIETFFNQNLHK